MKRILLALAVIAATGCHAAISKQVPTHSTPVSYQDKGIEEAVVCKSKGDAMSYVRFAGDNDTKGFKLFIKGQMEKGTCRFLGNSDAITVIDHEVVLTGNGMLFIVQFTQGDDVWWASANYFPESYPRSGEWEDELSGEPIEGQLGEQE